MRIQDVSRWLMLGVLVYAPWAFGSTRPWSINLLNISTGLVLLIWLFSFAIERRWPKLPVWLVSLGVFLAGYAWWMAINAKFSWDPTTLSFQPYTPLLESAPGSIDSNRSWVAAQRVSALLGALCFLTEIGRNKRWRDRLVLTLALTGVSIAGFGLLQRALGAPSILWQAGDTGSTFFATYRYHSNAGAFLNLVWPLTAVLWVNSWRRRQGWLKIGGWGGAVLLCFCGVVVTGARAASAVTLFMLACWGAWIFWQIRRDQLPAPERSTVMVGAALLLLLVIAVAALTGLDVTARRWGKTEELFSMTNPRLLVDYVCLTMIPEAGWFGFGPGTFRVAFPYFSHVIGDSASGIWRYAHQDYLQTFIEWGYLGGVAWGALLIAGLVRAAQAARRWGAQTSFRDRALQFGVATAMGGTLLHSLVDFPLQIASIQIYFAALLALFWSQPHWEQARQLHQHIPKTV